VERASLEHHLCDPDRMVDYQMFRLREDVADLDAQLERDLTSPRGRFDVWLAARQVRNRTG
jgi:hypothetical protein